MFVTQISDFNSLTSDLSAFSDIWTFSLFGYIHTETVYGQTVSDLSSGLLLTQCNNFTKDHTGVFECCNPFFTKRTTYALNHHRLFSKACHKCCYYMNVFLYLLGSHWFQFMSVWCKNQFKDIQDCLR